MRLIGGLRSTSNREALFRVNCYMQPSSARPILKSAFLTIALLLSFATGGYAQQLKIFEDVPKESWEYGVLHKLEKLGVPAIRPSCPGYGGHAVQMFTRYEFAVVTKRTQ